MSTTEPLIATVSPSEALEKMSEAILKRPYPLHAREPRIMAGLLRYWISQGIMSPADSEDVRQTLEAWGGRPLCPDCAGEVNVSDRTGPNGEKLRYCTDCEWREVFS